MQIVFGVGELAFMDDQAGIDGLPFVFTFDNRLQNFVKGDNDVVEVHAKTHA